MKRYSKILKTVRTAMGYDADIGEMVEWVNLVIPEDKKQLFICQLVISDAFHSDECDCPDIPKKYHNDDRDELLEQIRKKDEIIDALTRISKKYLKTTNELTEKCNKRKESQRKYYQKNKNEILAKQKDYRER